MSEGVSAMATSVLSAPDQATLPTTHNPFLSATEPDTHIEVPPRAQLETTGLCTFQWALYSIFLSLLNDGWLVTLHFVPQAERYEGPAGLLCMFSIFLLLPNLILLAAAYVRFDQWEKYYEPGRWRMIRNTIEIGLVFYLLALPLWGFLLFPILFAS